MSVRDIQAYWNRFPNSNVGIITGEVSGLMVVDIDGPEGVASLEQIGFDPYERPTPMVKSGGGGIHAYFQYLDDPRIKTRSGILYKVDIRSTGGFIVAPPSRHSSGEVYTWIDGYSLEDIDPIEFSASWIEKALEEAKTRPPSQDIHWATKLLRGVREGSRNESAAKLAGRYINIGLHLDEVMALLELWNTSANDPPLPFAELERTVHSIYGKHNKIEDVDTDSLLSRISHIMGVDVRAVTLVMAIPENRRLRITFAIDGQEIEGYVSSDALLTPAKLQARVYEITGIMMPRLSQKETVSPNHRMLVTLLSQCAEVEDVDIVGELTPHGQVVNMVKLFVQSKDIVDASGSRRVPTYDVFLKDGRVWFNLHDFLRWTKSLYDSRENPREIGQLFIESGVIQSKFPRADRMMRTVWGIPEEWREVSDE